MRLGIDSDDEVALLGLQALQEAGASEGAIGYQHTAQSTA